MNRRTFIKMATAASVALATPELFASEPKCEWIPFTERMPEDLDKVAVFTYFKGGNVNILTGIVIASNHAEWLLDPIHDRYHGCYPDDVKVIKAAVSYSPDGFFGKNIDVLVYGNVEHQEVQEEINRAKWIKGKRVMPSGSFMLAPRHGRKITEYVGRNESYWFPIDEYIPKNLPKFPKQKKVKLELENGKMMLVKE